MLTRRDYQNALDAQYACNLTGIVRTFAEVTDKLWEESREVGGGTDYVNTHPISVLYAEQVYFLSGSSSGYSGAYEKAQEEVSKAVIATE